MLWGSPDLGLLLGALGGLRSTSLEMLYKMGAPLRVVHSLFILPQRTFFLRNFHQRL